MIYYTTTILRVLYYIYYFYLFMNHKIQTRLINIFCAFMFELSMTRLLWYWPLIIVFNLLYKNVKNWNNLGKIWTYKHYKIDFPNR